MNNVSRLAAIALVVFAVVAPNRAQQQTREPIATFKSQSNLVLVPVQVRNKGQHVPGLKKEDFSLQQDGKDQTITLFEEVRSTTERYQRAKTAANQFTNEIVGSPETARYTIIAIDRVNTGTMDMHRVHDGLSKFLTKTFDNGEPIRLMAIDLNGIKMIQDFTTDPKALAKALQNTRPGGEVSGKTDASIAEVRQMIQETDNTLGAAATDEDAARMSQFLTTLKNAQVVQERLVAFQQRSTRINALQALQQIALSLAGLPGRKSLVWVSSGYPFASMAREGSGTTMTAGGLVAGASSHDFSSVLEATALDTYTTHLLSSANVAVYPVSASGTTNPLGDAFDPSQKYSPTYAQKEALLANAQDVKTTFQRLALGTGGKACLDRTDLSGCFKDALDESSDYYMVGFYVDRTATKDGWHKLQVKLNNKDASVRARTGFLYPIPDPTARRDRDMTLAMTSLLTDSGLPFKGEWTTTEPKGDKRLAKFSLQVDPRARLVESETNKLNLEIAGIARAKDGTIVGKFAQKIERTLPAEAVSTIQNQGLAYKNAIELPPGDYLVRFVVRDNNTGRMGTASSLLKVE